MAVPIPCDHASAARLDPGAGFAPPDPARERRIVFLLDAAVAVTCLAAIALGVLGIVGGAP